MTNTKSPVVYVDGTVISLLPQQVRESDPVFEEWYATKMLWKSFREERVRLVTHGKETETDLILWFNGQGCCITDTLRAIEAIREFESWNKADKVHIQQYKQTLIHFEELELLRLPVPGSGEYQRGNEIAQALLRETLQENWETKTQEDREILRSSLTELEKWYTVESWKDLKRTNYDLNWRILEAALVRHGREATLEGSEGDRNRYVFGLFNRAVGLAKKSCGKLPVPESHINFVITMVFQKYRQNQAVRGVGHLLSCIRNNIHVYVTLNHPFIQSFTENKGFLGEALQMASLNVDIMGPQRFSSEVLRYL